jgi:hypothetical protein
MGHELDVGGQKSEVGNQTTEDRRQRGIADCGLKNRESGVRIQNSEENHSKNICDFNDFNDLNRLNDLNNRPLIRLRRNNGRYRGSVAKP